MAATYEWRHASASSVDPYGDWASVDGADFLIDYKRDLKRYDAGQGGAPQAWAILPAAEEGGPGAGPAALPFFFPRQREDKRRSLEIFAAPDVSPDQRKRLIVPLALRQDALPEEDEPPMAFDRDEHGVIKTLPSDVREPELGEDDVIMVVVDHLPNVAHAAFARADGLGSRVLWAWMQEGRRKPGAPTPFGRSLSGHEIDAVLAEGLDPQEAMRRLGLIDPRRDQQPSGLARSTHGTAVAALAAGRLDPSAPPTPAERAWLMMVGLPAFANWDHSGLGLTTFVTFALHHALQRALRLMIDANKPNTRVIVNLSYGIAGGPHNGRDLMGGHIDGLFAEFDRGWRGHFGVGAAAGFQAPIAVTIPAGNGLQSRSHARRVRADGEATTELEVAWRIPPGDRTSSFMEVWLPKAARDVTVVVAPPIGPAETWRPRTNETGRLKSAARRLLAASTGAGPGEGVVARLSAETNFFAFKTQRLVLAVAPTDASAASSPRLPAPCGVWRVRVSASLPENGAILAWIQREDQTVGLVQRGRPSYFEDPAYARFDALGRPGQDDAPTATVRRHGTINGAAEGRQAVVAGAYRLSDGRPTDYSAASDPTDHFGATTQAGGRKERVRPAVLMPVDRSRALPGLLTATQTGGGGRLSGTSAAAPLAARWLADFGRWSIEPWERLREAAKANETAIASTAAGPEAPLHGPPERIGDGRLPRRVATDLRRLG